MMLDIAEDESRELCMLLNARLREMLHELNHTDDREYRQDLRSRYDRLEKLRSRLSGCS